MITVCILAKNSSATLEATLDSVSDFPEVVLLDNGSTDETLEIARRFPNVRVFETSFKGFGPLRNESASHASNDWILALDTDESISPALLAELRALNLNDSSTIYSMPRKNTYNGKHITGCGWHPDRVVRLYHRGHTRYSEDAVHEAVLEERCRIACLTSPILHVPFRSTTEFLAKMQHYSSLYASQHKGKKRSSPTKAFFHSLFAFFRSYFLQRGFLLGWEGFTISLYNSNTVYYKYLKLWERE